MKQFNLTIIALTLIFPFCSCNSNLNGNSATTKAELIRLDNIVANFSSHHSNEQIAIIDSLSIPLNDYIYLMGASTGDISASIDSLSHTAAFAMFKPEVDKVFTSTEILENDLGKINTNIQEILPSLPDYVFYGIISPYRQQVMLVDSTIYIALNHYLGANHEAYSSMPEFTRATKQSAYIPVDVAEAIVSIEYPYVADDTPTAIQYLLYEGVKVQAISMLTGIDDIPTLMGWNAEQASSVESQEAAIWRKMAEDNIIYSTDMSIARRLCEPAPNSRAVSPDLPGRVGRYVGYRIVSSYLDNNQSATLSDILSPDFYNNPSTLINSAYTPE